MTAKILLLPFVLAVASCDKPEPIAEAPAPERKLPSPPKIEASPAVSDSSPSTPAQTEPQQAAAPEKTTVTLPPAAAKPKTSAVPEAMPVEGSFGMVISPHSGKIVDVREIPSGTLVADPTYPPEEKKLFRVP